MRKLLIGVGVAVAGLGVASYVMVTQQLAASKQKDALRAEAESIAKREVRAVLTVPATFGDGSCTELEATWLCTGSFRARGSEHSYMVRLRSGTHNWIAESVDID